MRDYFFAMYQEIAYKECYYTCCQRHAQQLSTMYTVTMFIVSALSVLLWSVSKSLPTVWAIVIALAQMAQALKDYFPWQQQILSTKHLNPAIRKLLDDIEVVWLEIEFEKLSDDDILHKMSEFKSHFNEIESEFVGDLSFPRSKNIMATTEQEWKRVFLFKYPSVNSKEENVCLTKE